MFLKVHRSIVKASLPTQTSREALAVTIATCRLPTCRVIDYRDRIDLPASRR